MKKYRITCDIIRSQSDKVNKKCFYGVSLLQNYNYDQQLIAISNYLEENFSDVNYIVADDLIKYTFSALGFSDQAAEEKVNHEISQWKTHAESLGFDFSNPNIMHWKDCLSIDGFTYAQEFVNTLYNECPEFSSAVELSTSNAFISYLQRYKDLIQEANFDANIAIENCRKFVLEETAVILNIAKIYSTDETAYILYPKVKENKNIFESILRCFDIALEKFEPTKLKFVFLDIQKYKSRENSVKINNKPVNISSEESTENLDSMLYKLHYDLKEQSNKILDTISKIKQSK